VGLKNRQVTVEVLSTDTSRGNGDGAAADSRSRLRVSRRTLFGGAGAACGGVIIGGLLPLALSQPSAKQDVQVLNLALDLERLQEAFYAEALGSSLKLSGDWNQYSRVVGGHERAHRKFLEKALGGDVNPPPDFDFGNAFEGEAKYRAAVVALEEAGLAAYNGQAANLTSRALAAAARIVSVEARHASWARDLAGENPAPDATDKAIGAKQATRELQQLGLQS
jgi:hypothetical protein